MIRFLRSRDRRCCPFRRLTTLLLRATLLLLLVQSSAWAGLQFEFDYTYDTSGFFDDPARREALELAGRLVNRYVDDLDPIVPEGSNGWTAFLTRPDGGNFLVLTDEVIPENTLVVYPGGRSLPCCLAQSEGLHPVPRGDETWMSTVMYRGETGASASPATDFGAAGGMISFAEEVNWHFGTSTVGLNTQEFDFVTVAMHEMLHLMGFASNVADSFNDRINASGQFIGPESVAVGSPTNPDLQLDSIDAHWIEGTKSTWNGSSQEALLAPGIFPGRRAMPTLLDRATLRDIGWEEASPGDATLDRRFNTQDLIRVFQAGLYESSAWAGWADGDWNDDARFESDDLIAALQTGTYEQNNAVAALLDSGSSDRGVDVAYDQFSGELNVTALGTPLTSLQITSQGSAFTRDAQLTGLFDVNREDKLFVMDVDGFFEQQFGSVLPVGLSAEQLQSDLRFAGSWYGGGALAEVTLRVVPEPESLAIWLLAAGWLGRRRARGECAEAKPVPTC